MDFKEIELQSACDQILRQHDTCKSYCNVGIRAALSGWSTGGYIGT